MKKYYSCLVLILNFFFLVSFAQPSPPKITSFSPASGPMGTSVSIIGTSFLATPANNFVYFGATKAVVTTASTTSLTVTVPAGASFQDFSVTTSGTNYTALSEQPFVVTFPCGGFIDTTYFPKIGTYTTGTNPYALAAADLNADGKIEVAVANPTANTVSIYDFNTATFAATLMATLTTGTYPVSVAIGDLNGDGKPDIAVTNYSSNTVSVFKNTSTATISFAAKVDYASGTNPWDVAISDLNVDGRPDIVVTNKGGSTVSVYGNTGTSGTISFAAQATFATGSLPYGLALGDLDGDGKPEIATANESSNTVSVLKNNGGLTFAAKVDFTTGTYPFSVAIGDLDGDGYPDLAVANSSSSSNSISVLRNTGNLTININTFATKVDFTTGTSPMSVAIGDLDGDGKLELVSANSGANTISMLKNTSTSGIINSSSFAAKVDFSSQGSSPQDVVIADWNVDGKADILAVNQYSNNILGVVNNTDVTPTMTSSSNAGFVCSGDTLKIQLTSNIASTYSWVAANNPNTTGESTTLQTGSVINDVIINNTASAQVVTYTVTPTSVVNGCAGTSEVITVTINPLPVVSFTGLTANYCLNVSAQTLTGSPAGGTFSGAGVTGNAFTPSAAGSGTATITYTYTDGNSCTNSLSQTAVVLSPPPAPDICLVTVDSVSKNNIIVWDKTTYTTADSFYVYRDTANNNFALIGKVPYDSLSMFTDTVRSLYSANGDPNVASWRYKIAIKDTCGNLSALSPYHQTLFIQNNSGNFSWNDYKIEGQQIPVPQLSNYICQRDNASNGNWISIQTLSASSTAYTDPNYTAYQTTARWRTQTVWSISCTPTIISPKDPVPDATNFNLSRSNSYRANNPNSVNSISGDNNIAVYPNPNNGIFIIKNDNLKIEKMTVYNIVGEKIYSAIPSQNNSSIIDLSKQSKGVYYLQLSTGDKIVTRKIVIE